MDAGNGLFARIAKSLGANQIILVEKDGRALEHAKALFTTQGWEKKDFLIL